MAAECGWQTFIPALKYCTDNAAMIGMQASYLYANGIFSDQQLEASASVK